MLCKSCQINQPESAFYIGNKSRCKECVRKEVRANRLEKIEHYRQYDRQRASMPHRMAQNARTSSAWRRVNKAGWAAQIALNNAVRLGKVVRLPCMICGERAVAHHPDYSAPLDVVWLCQAHHKQTHALAKAA